MNTYRLKVPKKISRLLTPSCLETRKFWTWRHFSKTWYWLKVTEVDIGCKIPKEFWNGIWKKWLAHLHLQIDPTAGTFYIQQARLKLLCVTNTFWNLSIPSLWKQVTIPILKKNKLLKNVATDNSRPIALSIYEKKMKNRRLRFTLIGFIQSTFQFR